MTCPEVLSEWTGTLLHSVPATYFEIQSLVVGLLGSESVGGTKTKKEKKREKTLIGAYSGPENPK